MARAIGKGEAGVNEDFAFHRTIAVATGNQRYVEFLEFLGRHVIPRQSIGLSLCTAKQHGQYLARIQKEHHRICNSICEGDATEARKAMRSHLSRSLKRYRGLAQRELNGPDSAGHISPVS